MSFKNYSLSGTIGYLQFPAINYPLHKTGRGESEGSQHTEIIYEMMGTLITLITLL